MFKEQINLGDQAQVALACGFCGAPATPGHSCDAKRQAEEEQKRGKSTDDE